jgi:hypothetical protein
LAKIAKQGEPQHDERFATVLLQDYEVMFPEGVDDPVG